MSAVVVGLALVAFAATEAELESARDHSSVPASCSSPQATPYGELLCLELELRARGGAGAWRALSDFERTHPEWARSAAALRIRIARFERRALLTRIALVAFALSFSLLLLLASRSLLHRPRAAIPVGLGGGLAVSSAAMGGTAPSWVAAVVIVSLTGLVAVHAAEGASNRALSAPRIRVLLSTLALVAVASQILLFASVARAGLLAAGSGTAAVRVDGGTSPP